MLQDGLKEMGTAASEGGMSTFAGVAPDKLMLDRIASFEEGRSAIRQMKESLSALVAELKAANGELQPPIIIVIDELDRCRPTYAVKVLEEVKHLFDVHGLIFIFGMYGDQLAHSVAGAYGPGFNGLGYLRRFFDRRYKLAEPSLEPLVQELLKRTGLTASLISPAIGGPGTAKGERRPSEIISRYMRAYDLRARDAFELVDMLQTAVALADARLLHLPYLLPLIIGHLRHLPSGELPAPTANPAWHFLIDDRHSRREVDLFNLAREYEAAAIMTDDQFDSAESQDRLTVVEQAVRTTREPYQTIQPLGAVPMYRKLVATIGRFTNPQIAADEAGPEPRDP